MPAFPSLSNMCEIVDRPEGLFITLLPPPPLHFMVISPLSDQYGCDHVVQTRVHSFGTRKDTEIQSSKTRTAQNR